MTLSPVKRKMFNVDMLQAASKVFNIKSWLEDTLDRKRKRKEEGVPNKETLSLAIHSRSTLSKAKKQKTLSILIQDPDTRILTMKIAKPTKKGRIKDMFVEDFTFHSIDLEEVRHETKLGLWKSTNDVIEGQLERLKLAKVIMKVKIHELNYFIRQLVTLLASNSGVSTTSDPTTIVRLSSPRYKKTSTLSKW